MGALALLSGPVPCGLLGEGGGVDSDHAKSSYAGNESWGGFWAWICGPRAAGTLNELALDSETHPASSYPNT
jgi:hypothetical protein